jgi:Transposase DNA-binding/Transposase Tn5 dimerisation domain
MVAPDVVKKAIAARPIAAWVIEEMKDADLQDRRLNRRLNRILSDLADRPTASIPAACGGKTETVAAYRFFDNDRVDPQDILAAHFARTRLRIAAQPTAILVPDTTELDLTRPERQVDGAGPLDDGSRRGALLHPLAAFTEDGTPLGAVAARMWARDEPDPSRPRRDRKRTPIEEKESHRWLEDLRRARAVAAEAPTTRCIFVADSESDIYEVLAEPRGGPAPVEWVIRACQDRGLEAEEGEAARRLRAAVAAAPVLLTRTITVRARRAEVACERRERRRDRSAREAEVEVRAARVELRPPWRPDRRLAAVAVNVVQVREVTPPAGEAAVEWLLVTTLPIDTAEDVSNVIRYYTVRWMIEVFFRVLKSGCRVEERRFEHVDRELNFVAVALIVAWRVLMACRLGRSCPDIECEAVFEPSEWEAVYVAMHRRPAPKRPPRLGEMIRLIAQLGGYVNTPGRTDPPGPQALWLGMQRMADLAWAWETFGPGAGAAMAPGALPGDSEETSHSEGLEPRSEVM